MIGVVLAGGASRRFSGEAKGLKLFRGSPMVVHAARMLSDVCERVVIEGPADGTFAGLGFACISAPVRHAGKGPLAGIVAGLGLADAQEQVAFAPCDMPLLAGGIYARLGGVAGGAYAVSPSGAEPLVCVLPSTALAGLMAVLDTPEIPRLQDVLAACGATGIAFDTSDAFSNVNTPEDLARLNGGADPV